ncbi:MAG: hypothetical protein WCH04_17890, partial [Gammaproteobacteria bacterium]
MTTSGQPIIESPVIAVWRRVCGTHELISKCGRQKVTVWLTLSPRIWPTFEREANTYPSLCLVLRLEQALELNWERVLQEVRARHTRAEAGDAATQLEIGREILQQAGTDPALIEKAYDWIERAAESGSVEAQYQLAIHYL